MALGDIAAAVTATLEFDTTYGAGPIIAHVTGDYYLVAYSGNGDTGELATFTITSAGVITAVDTLQIDATLGTEFTLVHISGTMWAVCFRGTGSDGFLKTFTVDATGQLPGAVTATREFDTTAAYAPYMVHVQGNRYLVIYGGGSGATGNIAVWTIEDDGTIGSSALDSTTITVFAETGMEAQVVRISGEVFAFTYRGSGQDGFIQTVSIADSGAITAVANLEYDTGNVVLAKITHVVGSIYLIGYRSDEPDVNDGYLRTIRILDDGTISGLVDFLRFDSNMSNVTDVFVCGVQFDSATVRNLVAFLVKDNGGELDLHTIAIDDDGSVAAAVIDTLVIDSTGFEGKMVEVSANMYGIAFRGTDSDGFLVSVNVETVDPGHFWFEGDRLHYIDENGVEQKLKYQEEEVEFMSNAFMYPNPGTDWTHQVEGAHLSASLTSKKVWLPLNFLKIGDKIVSFKLVGDATETNALTLDCKLVHVNKADPLTTSDIAGGGITQVTAGGNFDVEATLTNEETIATDKQYALEILGTTGASDTITVIGAEVKVKRV